MAGVSFIINEAGVLDALKRLEAGSSDQAAAYHAIGAHFVFSTQRNFESETAPDGTKWRPLSPRYAASRIGRGQSRGLRGTDHILRLTNRLYDSISYRVLPDGVEWGTNRVYGRIHQLGGTINLGAREATISLKSIRRKGNRFVRFGTKGSQSRTVRMQARTVTIPARPYLGISDADRAELANILADHQRQAVGR